jgi:hypothetical protein
MTKHLGKVLEEVRKERVYQDKQWGHGFDDKNTMNDWASYMMQYLGKAVDMKTPVEEARMYFLKATTLGIAALETYDRNGNWAPRHYDPGAENKSIPENKDRERL